jgi:hypothetical protein
MRKSASISFIHHKYDLITSLHVGSSLLGPLSPIYRQFGLWARYMGDSPSRQDHLNFYKWLSFEFAAPIGDLSTQNRAHTPYLANSTYFHSNRAR